MNTNLVNLIPQFFDSSGNPLSGGTLETYVAGTSTTLATYPTNADALAGTNANSTSITLNSSGYPASGGNVVGVFLKPGKQYKFILKDSGGTTQYTVDNISNLTDVIYDANGNEVLKFSAVASAVNEITITNAATGNSPQIATTGDDTNAGLIIKTKGTGTLQLLDGSSNELIKLTTTANAINEFTVANAATGNSPTLSATGDDTNIDINYQTKGTGVNKFKGTSTAQAEIRLYEQTSNGTNYVGLKPPASVASDISFILPSADGTANQPLVTDAAGTLSFASIGFTSVQVFTASGTWTKPAGITKVLVYVTGGGGGGGGADNTQPAAGGAAGGTSIKWITSSLGTSQTVTVGTGGSGGASTATGGGGNTSSFGAFCTATGGSGGAYNSGGASGGTGSSGDINITGGSSAPIPTGGGTSGGNGGASFWGGGGNGGATGGGGSGAAYGSGGGGSGKAVASGGAGKDGIVIVFEYK